MLTWRSKRRTKRKRPLVFFIFLNVFFFLPRNFRTKTLFFVSSWRADNKRKRCFWKVREKKKRNKKKINKKRKRRRRHEYENKKNTPKKYGRKYMYQIRFIPTKNKKITVPSNFKIISMYIGTSQGGNYFKKMNDVCTFYDRTYVHYFYLRIFFYLTQQKGTWYLLYYFALSLFSLSCLVCHLSSSSSSSSSSFCASSSCLLRSLFLANACFSAAVY